jgi:hypothetical protein
LEKAATLTTSADMALMMGVQPTFVFLFGPEETSWTDRLADENENAIVNVCAAKLPSVLLTSNQGVYDSEACEPIEVAIC